MSNPALAGIKTVFPTISLDIIHLTGADTGILEGGGGGVLHEKLIGGGCGRGMCPLPREARKLLTDRHPAHDW